ncbi:hypothetical protein GCM10009733_008260 [Nonomuraea maheshkhaliensis]|uniref:Uncharacterized protein n=1 Tax=Nonomuraea maheshkhaliensis TaxID=419590 RepID=A0ABN2EU84_9ACTN
MRDPYAAVDKVEAAANAAGFHAETKEEDRRVFLTLTGHGKAIRVHYIVHNLATGYRAFHYAEVRNEGDDLWADHETVWSMRALLARLTEAGSKEPGR